ncbi:36.4 kDa proline-rich protein [Ditylenchus destructor]|uniref:36.4 kDa proline-rich protein n=1 Tax=Ditylenchus destructor TaxID=166010 RepID=A0AAD4MIR4_9BILA|nr:36.4 kDa proline-rich protein [Ditylenchus destructor]
MWVLSSNVGPTFKHTFNDSNVGPTFKHTFNDSNVGPTFKHTFNDSNVGPTFKHTFNDSNVGPTFKHTFNDSNVGPTFKHTFNDSNVGPTFKHTFNDSNVGPTSIASSRRDKTIGTGLADKDCFNRDLWLPKIRKILDLGRGSRRSREPLFSFAAHPRRRPRVRPMEYMLKYNECIADNSRAKLNVA